MKLSKDGQILDFNFYCYINLSLTFHKRGLRETLKLCYKRQNWSLSLPLMCCLVGAVLGHGFF